MAFSVSDYQDLLNLLREHPEWKAELRQEILDEEFLRLPEYVRQNSADIRELKEVVAQNSADIRELKDAVSELRATVQQMGNILDRNVVRTDYAVGLTLELRYRTHPDGYFGHLLRRGRTVAADSLSLFASADEAEEISEGDARAVRALDIIVEGVQGRGDERRDALLAVEASIVIDKHDVDRAADRAAILQKVGYANTIPVVVGAVISADITAYAKQRGVEVHLDSDSRLAALAS
jgi:hypothetical protein